ncbi:MAG: hypothetical protein QM648_09870 [Solirubrobacterales bacterium]
MLEIKHAGVLAAICKDPDGSFWLAHDASELDVDPDWFDDGEEPEDTREEVGERIEGFEVLGGGSTIDGVSVIGGALPEGASVPHVDGHLVVYEVKAAEGFWIAVALVSGIFFGTSVTFWDREGSPVRLPLPGYVDTETLEIDDAACPECKSCAWLLASVPHREWTEGDDEFFVEWSPGTRRAVCEVCGRTEQLAMQSTSPPMTITIPRETRTEAEATEARRASRENAWRMFRDQSGVVPVGLAPGAWQGGEVRVGWSGPEPDEVTDVSARYGTGMPWQDPSVTISTFLRVEDEDPSASAIERDIDVMDLGGRIAWLRGEGLERPFDRPEDELRDHLASRRGEQEAAAIERRDITIPIDGRPTVFSLLQHELCWLARGSIGAAKLRIDAAGIEPSDLQLASLDAATAEN